MAYHRTDRISEEMRKEIDKIIREDIRDPRVSGTYSITRVDVTRDLRYAKVFISVYEGEKREDLINALKNAAGFIRREIGHRMMLRYTPELLFELDTNIEYGVRMIKLIDDLSPSKPVQKEEDGEEIYDDEDDE